MNANKQLIVFAEDWGRLPSSTQHIISALLQSSWQVVWINSIGMRQPTFSWFYIKRFIGKLKQLVTRKSKNKIRKPDNLTIINPLTIPIYGVSYIDSINRWILKQQLFKITFTKPLVWISLPTALPYLELFKTSPIIYYCCDDFSVFDGINMPIIDGLEKKLIAKANLHIISNPLLAKKMPTHSLYFLDHGVDLQQFQKPYPRPKDLPTGKPIAGFYGCLSTWIDVPLLKRCATELPNINFVFIGPCEIDISTLLPHNNVFYLGYKPYADIPAYSQHWDVSLLPFLQQQRTLASNPLTLKEYLSSGKPVVSIDLPILKTFEKVVYLAQTPEAFVAAIPLAIQDNKEQERKQFIQNYSWEHLAKQLEPTILDLKKQDLS